MTTDDGPTLDDLPTPAYDGRLPPGDLEVDGNNPNEMTDEQFGLLCDRMQSNGWLGGPIITNTDGVIADGEHRWRAAQEINLQEVPVKQYPIDEPTRRLWRQELNKIHGEHDKKRDALEYDYPLHEGLSDEVTALTDAADEDLDELLAEIRMDANTRPAYEYDPDHNVYFEDCIQGMHDRLDDNSVDLIFTSPPYNVEKSQGGTRDSPVVEYSDDLGTSEFRQFLGEVFDELARVLKPSGHAFINIQIDNRNGTITPPYWVPDRVPLDWRSYIIWNKNAVPHGTMGANRRGRFYLSWEPIYHFSGDDRRELNGTRNFSVWDVGVVRGNELEETDVHPAPFPVELVTRAIDATTKEGDMVLDPFMGSGTTAVAAIQKDRDYIGFELDEEGAYKPIIERRISEAKRQRHASVNQNPDESDEGEMG